MIWLSLERPMKVMSMCVGATDQGESPVLHADPHEIVLGRGGV